MKLAGFLPTPRLTATITQRDGIGSSVVVHGSKNWRQATTPRVKRTQGTGCSGCGLRGHNIRTCKAAA